ncbi:hypothetical protein CEY16_07140 [Halalkalibacillus sediminis]|uniref:RNA polymerase sigma-70 region 2 domain-containing protein n=1 Tax=Halalkalibacillus sediminis TaxID=2018042 RepID=A0A2I0QUC5_9BACI|nr:sigma-70 family RNA polymerase sigma factor [Halalkalibacillus sediminis]PKR77700.1 hypothetical protein CEY16_07140 [Halalkalibacillus sediminis]
MNDVTGEELYTDDFEKVLVEYKKMIHHVIHKLNIKDPHGDFYQEGMVALWEAHGKYADFDTFPKLAYITIRSRLIDTIRKSRRIQENETASEMNEDEGAWDGRLEGFDPEFWQVVRNALTDKQWIFVGKRLIEGKSYKEIAFEGDVTVDAVKGWGKEVKRKLKPVLTDFL